MGWSTQNVQNAISNIFWVQRRADIKKLLGRHFSPHQSRAETLKQ
jgi:hypothetical protein